jgi:hypothetical protein
MVLPMDRGPRLGHHTGGQPEPKAEEMTDDGVQVEGAVRLAAVQKDGYGGDGDVRDHKRIDDVTPPRQIECARQQLYRHALLQLLSTK